MLCRHHRQRTFNARNTFVLISPTPLQISSMSRSSVFLFLSELFSQLFGGFFSVICQSQTPLFFCTNFYNIGVSNGSNHKSVFSGPLWWKYDPMLLSLLILVPTFLRVRPGFFFWPIICGLLHCQFQRQTWFGPRNCPANLGKFYDSWLAVPIIFISFLGFWRLFCSSLFLFDLNQFYLFSLVSWYQFVPNHSFEI